MSFQTKLIEKNHGNFFLFDKINHDHIHHEFILSINKNLYCYQSQLLTY